MKAPLFAVHALCVGSCAVAFAEDFPRFYEVRDPGAAKAFALEQAADLRASFSPFNERFDIGVGMIAKDVYSPQGFTFAELEHFWRTQAAGRFVCVTLDKNDLGEEQRNKLIRRLAEYLFKCGVRRVRIHQGDGLGVGVLFDEDRK